MWWYRTNVKIQFHRKEERGQKRRRKNTQWLVCRSYLSSFAVLSLHTYNITTHRDAQVFVLLRKRPSMKQGLQQIIIFVTDLSMLINYLLCKMREFFDNNEKCPSQFFFNPGEIFRYLALSDWYHKKCTLLQQLLMMVNLELKMFLHFCIKNDSSHK